MTQWRHPTVTSSLLVLKNSFFTACALRREQTFEGFAMLFVFILFACLRGPACFVQSIIFAFIASRCCVSVASDVILRRMRYYSGRKQGVASDVTTQHDVINVALASLVCARRSVAVLRLGWAKSDGRLCREKTWTNRDATVMFHEQLRHRRSSFHVRDVTKQSDFVACSLASVLPVFSPQSKVECDLRGGSLLEATTNSRDVTIQWNTNPGALNTL